MDIGGIPVYRNYPEGSSIEEANLTWEREWSSGFMSLGLFALHQIDNGLIRLNDVDREKDQSGGQRGLDVLFNQLLGKSFGLFAAYNYRDIKDDALPQADREDHLLLRVGQGRCRGENQPPRSGAARNSRGGSDRADRTPARGRLRRGARDDRTVTRPRRSVNAHPHRNLARLPAVFLRGNSAFTGG